MQRSRKRPDKIDLEIFLDRSLGRYYIPEKLRERITTVRTMESEYGAKASETLPDTEWLALAGQMGWVVLTKDAAIRRNPLEREVVEAERVKMFVITKAGLTADEQLDRILPNLHRIALRAAKPGPFIHGLYPTGIRQLWPEADSP